MNSPCDTTQATYCNRRMFVPQTTAEYSFVSNTANLGVQYSFLLDMDNNGKQDIIFISLAPNGTTKINAIYNNFAYDEFHLGCVFNFNS
jgi:hypothetical protein